MAYMQIIGVLLVYYCALFIIGQVKKNNSIVDIAWGFGFVLVAWVAFVNGPKSINGLVVTLLVSIWGLRLTYHIGKRNIGKPEDFRYQNFRKQWGDKFPRIKAFFHVYILQMILLMLIAVSYVMTNLWNEEPLSLMTYIGLGVWLLGFTFEALGDYQLKKFKKDKSNKGKIITSGLYKYTRHPNYFGEATLWWGIYIIGLTDLNTIWTVIAPLTITILVRFVSGVPMLEKKYMDRDDFKAYAMRTNVFVPWFRKKG